MKKTYIVTETGGDLFRRDAEKYEIEIVPMHVQIEGESRDDGAFPVTDIFDSYKRTKVLPKTSATNPHEYKEAFDRIMAKNPDAQIIHVAYSAITTASYHNAVLAAEKIIACGTEAAANEFNRANYKIMKDSFICFR